MPNTINLLEKASQKKEYRKIRNITLSGTFVLILVLIIAGSAVYAYWFILKNQVENVDTNIVKAQSVIESLKNVEEQKSVVTYKVNEIQTLYDARFDYLKAIDDIETLFGHSLTVDSLELDETGDVAVEAVKTGEITLDEDSLFSTNINTISLNLTVSSSDELENTLANLQRFVGQGLSRVTIASSSLNAEEGGYDVTFDIIFSNNDVSTESSEINVEQFDEL